MVPAKVKRQIKQMAFPNAHIQGRMRDIVSLSRLRILFSLLKFDLVYNLIPRCLIGASHAILARKISPVLFSINNAAYGSVH